MLFNFYKYNKKYLIKNKCYYGTIFKTPELLQTEPEGSPADDVGIVLIDRLFTNVVQVLSEVMFAPTMNDVVPVEDIVFPLPAKIPLNEALTVFPLPPPTNEHAPDEVLHLPPTTEEAIPDDVFLYPPLTVENATLLLLQLPPPTNEQAPPVEFCIPPVNAE